MIKMYDIDSPENEKTPLCVAFFRCLGGKLTFAEKGEKGKEEGEGRRRKEEGRKEGV